MRWLPCNGGPFDGTPLPVTSQDRIVLHTPGLVFRLWPPAQVTPGHIYERTPSHYAYIGRAPDRDQHALAPPDDVPDTTNHGTAALHGARFAAGLDAIRRNHLRKGKASDPDRRRIALLLGEAFLAAWKADLATGSAHMLEFTRQCYAELTRRRTPLRCTLDQRFQANDKATQTALHQIPGEPESLWPFTQRLIDSLEDYARDYPEPQEPAAKRRRTPRDPEGPVELRGHR